MAEKDWTHIVIPNPTSHPDASNPTIFLLALWKGSHNEGLTLENKNYARNDNHPGPATTTARMIERQLVQKALGDQAIIKSPHGRPFLEIECAHHRTSIAAVFWVSCHAAALLTPLAPHSRRSLSLSPSLSSYSNPRSPFAPTVDFFPSLLLYTWRELCPLYLHSWFARSIPLHGRRIQSVGHGRGASQDQSSPEKRLLLRGLSQAKGGFPSPLIPASGDLRD